MADQLLIVITDAGRAALINADHTGTAPVAITEIGLSAGALVPAPSLLELPGEIKRIATSAGQVVAADMIHVTMFDSGPDTYTLRSLALYLEDGTLFGIYGQPGPILEKTSSSIAALAIDVVLADIDAALIEFGNVSFTNPPATEEIMGVAEYADGVEAAAGLVANRALSPFRAKAALMTWLLAQDGAGSLLDADKLDGQEGAYYTNIIARLGYTPLDLAQFTAAQILTRLLTVDGSGSLIDADMLDGLHAADFAARSQFTGANQLLAANGYQKFPGGLIEQWGESFTTGGEGTYTIAFPIPFPNACFAPVGIIKAGTDMWLQLQSYNQAGATFRYQSTGGNTGAGFTWQAKGY